MKILVDTSVVSNANLLVSHSRDCELSWGPKSIRRQELGFQRASHSSLDQEIEVDALFTVGQLARRKEITLFTSIELRVEKMRGGFGHQPLLNALHGCQMERCTSPIERSKFAGSFDMESLWAKGGKKDRKKGFVSRGLDQISFFSRLAALTPSEIEALKTQRSVLKLADFEVASFSDLAWYQSLAQLVGSSENLPDCFHIWTARRNSLDAFLTMEKKLPRTIQQIQDRRVKAIDLDVAIIRPTNLLQLLDVEMVGFRLEANRFYTYLQVLKCTKRYSAATGHNNRRSAPVRMRFVC